MSSNTLKVRDRTTNKIKDVLVDHDDYERLKGYNYLLDKNSKEPFREISLGGGKRPRIALKRDVMNFSHGDPRRVCYVNKANVMDCRRVNLKTKAEESTGAKVAKVVKTVSVPEKTTTVTVAVSSPIPTPMPVDTLAAMVAAPTPVRMPERNETLDIKKALLGQIDLNMLANFIPMDSLLAAWAESNGYKKQA
jgi:hypothetical protein